MIAEYKKKAYGFMFGGVALSVLSLYVEPLSTNPVKGPDPALTLTVLASRVVAYVLWVVGCVYFARAKGYSPVFGLFGLLSMPGLIVLACLTDNKKDV